eukprot:11625890-Alexandrium_andersonii.AAC.1
MGGVRASLPGGRVGLEPLCQAEGAMDHRPTRLLCWVYARADKFADRARLQAPQKPRLFTNRIVGLVVLEASFCYRGVLMSS